MRFINDDEIEAVPQKALGMLGSARLCDRGDQALLAPEPVGIAAHERVMSGRARDVELGFQFLAPLSDQRCRRQDQHALHHAAQEISVEPKALCPPRGRAQRAAIVKALLRNRAPSVATRSPGCKPSRIWL